jgi:uncharacterized protein YqjF (DUF2071 family)
MSEWVVRQLIERQLPVGGRAMMYQCWKKLLFLHWRWEAGEIQKRLPIGLSIDCFDGSAWIGIVPFFMSAVRPTGFPPLPVISDFLELNLRTYVRDESGRPGIWFFSLDANQPLAVWAARIGFALPYRHAVMYSKQAGSWTDYVSTRNGYPPVLNYRYRYNGAADEPVLGSLEFFLIERYRLFAFRNGQLLTSRVSHAPYLISRAEVDRYDARLLELEGLDAPDRGPDHVCYAHRIDVSVYPPEKRRKHRNGDW